LLGITWHGEASLTRGNLQGMLTLHRVGDMDLTPEGNNLVVRGTLGFTVLQANAKFYNQKYSVSPLTHAISQPSKST
jgi:hypothetical protein